MTANTPKTRKAKGRTFQKEIVTIIQAVNPEFEPGDLGVALMGEAGEDIKVKNPAKKWLYMLATECKRTENLNLTGAFEQAKKRREKDIIPILAHRKSRHGPLITLSAVDFFMIYRGYALYKRGVYE